MTEPPKRPAPRPGDVTAEHWRALLKRYGSLRGIELALGYSRNSTSRHLRRLGIEYDCTHRNLGARAKAEALEGWREQLPGPEVLRWPVLEKRRGEIAAKFAKVRKALVISDLHVPYQRADLVGEALRADGDADLCVIAGDLLHAEAFSPFLLKVPYRFELEWQKANEIVATIASFMPTVYLRANHERRLEKMLAGLPTEAHRFLRDRTPNLVQALVSDVAQAGVKGFEGIYDWWVRIGDAAICHADKYSKIHSRSVIGVARWFATRRNLYPDLRAVVQGHTHHLTNTIWQQFQCLESGCLCVPADYMMEGKTSAGEDEKEQLGYVVLEFDGKGRSDRNKCRFVQLEE